MYLILFVLNNPDQLERLLISWDEIGVEGATVLFSTGLGRIRQLATWRDDMPLIPSLSDFYSIPENSNRTIFTTVNSEEEAEAIVAATKSVVGDLNENETGLLLVLPLWKAYGVNKRKSS